MSGDERAHGSGGADPASVRTRADLAEALKTLRGTRSYRALERSVDGALPASTLSNLLTGRSVPSRETLVTYLAACGLDAVAQAPWLAARDRIAAGDLQRPSGAVLVRDARARMLGVHATIQVDPVPEADELPAYVPRDLDTRLRRSIATAAEHGGFVLVVGGSSVGKTRSLFEAVTSTMPHSWLLHPDDAAAVRGLAAQPPRHCVIWLDELQRYLDEPGGVPAAAVRRMVSAGVVVVATVWPGEYARRTAAPEPGQPDPNANDRDVLRLADIIDVPDRFSPTELARARTLSTDRRVEAALNTGDAGITQILAGGPDLVRHWENAPAEHCYGRAVITAALDARRVGVTTPLTRAFLEAAAPAYLTDWQQATAPPDWLDRALTYATSRLRGATAALCPKPAGMGRTAGYVPADYLHQHALRVRRSIHLPEDTWHALVDHHHPQDARRLADNAERRGQHHHGQRLRRAVGTSSDHTTAEPPTGRPARLLAECGVHLIVGLLTEQGHHAAAITVLREQADAGDRSAARRLIDLLVETGRVDELDGEVAAGTIGAAERLKGPASAESPQPTRTPV